MASNSKSTSLGNNYTLQAYFNETGTNTSGNYSTVYVEGKLSSGNINWSSSYNSYIRIYWHDNRENYDRLVAETPISSCGFNSSYTASGTINVTHNDDGNLSGYAYATFTKGGTSNYAPNTGGVNTDWTALTSIARKANVTSANDFTDEQNPSMKFSNPGGFTMNVWLEPNPNGTHLCVRNNISNTGTYTWTLTEEERNQLRAACTGNSCKVRYGIYTIIGSNTYSSYVDKTMTIVNGNPTFDNFTFADVNSTTTALTGNNQYSVNGYSNIKVTISTTNKATANKQATMSKYRFTCGTKSKDITYSDSASVTGQINAVPSGTFNVYAIDSRNNSKLVTKLATREIAYTPIYIDKQNTSVVRNNNNVAILTLSGTLWKQSFGSVTNAIKSVTYKFRKTDSSIWITGTTTISPTVASNGKISFTGEIASDNQDTTWDLDASYDIQVTISDKLSTDTVNLILNSAIPTMSFDKNGVGVMCAYDESIGGKLQVDGRRIDNYITKYIIEEDTNEFTIDDLDIGENNLLRITILPEFTSSTTETLKLLVNEITNYHTQSTRVYANGTATSQVGITVNADYIVGTSNYIGLHTMASYSRVQAELFIENGYLGYFSNMSRTLPGNQRNLWAFANTNVSIDSINKLTFFTDNQKIPAGTKIILEII